MSQTFPFFQIDAFASRAFMGNQACVMPMDIFLEDATLQAIAAENNVAETAFIVPEAEGCWALRWFTPTVEVPLCGHATLAAAHVIYQHLNYTGPKICFSTRQSGHLYVEKTDSGLQMDFPASPVKPIPVTDEIVNALGAEPMEVWQGNFMACIFADPESITKLKPDFSLLAQIGPDTPGWEIGNVGCLAMGGQAGADVTSRFFAPGSGIDEDPATGAWHCMLAPLIAARSGQTILQCYQAYPTRGAWIETRFSAPRVQLKGAAVSVIEGVFRL